MTHSQQLPLFLMEGRVSLSRQTTLAEAIQPFQLYLHREGKTMNTIKAFASDLNLMCQFFGTDRTVTSLSTRDLNRFLEWLEHGRGQTCSRKSYSRRVTTLKVFFKWLEKRAIRPDDPSKPILQRSGPAPLQPVLSKWDIETLLAYTSKLRTAQKPDARPDLLVRLLLKTAIKKNECMELTFDRINVSNPSKPTLQIRHPENRHDQYKERNLDLSPEWLRILEAYRVQYKVSNVIFPCTARNLEYVLHDTALAAGIEGRISFELLRWTSAVWDYINGMDLDSLRDKLGLSPISWRETGEKVQKIAQIQMARN